MTSIDPEVLEKLRQYDTPTVLNVIELFEVRPRQEGFLNGEIKACFPEMGPIVGYASTATFQRATEPAEGDAYSNLADQVGVFDEELPAPRIVVFEDIDPEPCGATFGEVMCTVYQNFGCAGLITSGGGRDLEQVRALGFPVFTGGTICSHGYGQWLHVGLPVRVGGLIVETGNLLHADANGVTNIPLEIASEIVDVAPEYIAAEELVIGYNKAPGEKNIAELVERAVACKAAIAEIQRRVSRAK